MAAWKTRNRAYSNIVQNDRLKQKWDEVGGLKGVSEQCIEGNPVITKTKRIISSAKKEQEAAEAVLPMLWLQERGLTAAEIEELKGYKLTVWELEQLLPMLEQGLIGPDSKDLQLGEAVRLIRFKKEANQAEALGSKYVSELLWHVGKRDM